MKRLLQFVAKNWPIFLLLGIESILFLANYASNTYLVGWDNLYPELNFLTNFKRGLFSIWQEYRGLGLVDGMSHVANLPHTLFIFLLSFILPQNLLRYFFVFLMHLLGGLGVYSLINQLLREYRSKRTVSFIGGLFYLFNIATIQMFYAPLELFTIHFAFLPWLVWSLLGYLKNGTKQSLAIFVITSFLSIPQAHVPTLFLVYGIALFTILGFHLFYTRGSGLKSVIAVLFLTFTINSFWGLPYIYSAFHNSKTIADSKINQMSTEDIYLKNKAYGDLGSIALMKGFSLDFVDLQGGVNDYMMAGWREHVRQPLFIVIALSFFGLAILGLVRIIVDGEKRFYPFVLLFIFSFLMLGTDIPILSIISGFFYTYIPYFFQIFRFTFTKFSILYAFSFSILLAFGLSVLLDSFTRIKHLNRILIFVLFFLFGYYSFPSWQGKLLYKNLRVKIPKEYFELVEYFKKQSENERIATLPQPSFWGWTYTNWGYRGSGFLWYGLPQATLDGAFYPWSRENENYYWEINNAIYSTNQQLLQSILEKYQIGWLIIDENIISQASAKTLYFDKLGEMVSQSDRINLAANFGKIKIYKVNVETSLKDYVFLANDLPVVGPKYNWNNYDKAYEEYGNYISQAEKGKSLLPFGSITQSRISNYSNSQSQNSQSKIEKSKIVDVKAHNFTFNNNKLITQKVSAAATPHTNITELNLSSAKGMTIVANATWPISEQISDNRLSWDLVDKSFIDNDNSMKSNSLSKDRGFNHVFAADYSDSSTIGGVMASQAQPATSPSVSLSHIYYPFRSLFTGRKQEELEFKVEDKGDYFSFKSPIPKELIGTNLVIPKINDEEISEVDAGDLSKSTKKYPQVFLDGEILYEQGRTLTGSDPIQLIYIREGNLEVRVPKINGYYSFNQQSTINYQQLKNCDQFNQGILKHDLISENGKQLLRLTSIGSSNCLDFDLSHLAQRLGYLVTIENRNIEGKSLLFSVINKNSQRADLETYLPKKLDAKRYTLDANKFYFIIPPMEPFGLGYALHLDNISIGRVKTVNDLGRITVNPIPYRFLTSLKIIKRDPLRTQGVPLQNLAYQVDHPNPSLYQITINPSTTLRTSNTTLVLSQSFDDGWKAYAINNQQPAIINYLFPFLFGKELKDHVLVNNWENGWILPDNSQQSTDNKNTIVIIYLPQYLEYLGFILFGAGILVVIFYLKSK